MKWQFRVLAILAALAICPAGVGAQASDPRTPAGQVTACGGFANWHAVGYLEFEVKIASATGEQGPWHYSYDRRDGLLRFSGPGPTKSKVDVAVDLGSRSGGAWENGAPLTAKNLADAVSWALQRFGEDILWLTFPLEWGAAGVSVAPLADATDANGKTAPATEVKSPSGTWKVTLDPATGRVARTVVERKGAGVLTVTWEDWQPTAGVFFAHRRTIAETGETVEVQVKQALPAAPPEAF